MSSFYVNIDGHYFKAFCQQGNIREISASSGEHTLNPTSPEWTLVDTAEGCANVTSPIQKNSATSIQVAKPLSKPSCFWELMFHIYDRTNTGDYFLFFTMLFEIA